jgi:hypothetical protein
MAPVSKAVARICSTWATDGARKICPDLHGVPMPAGNEAVLNELRGHVLDPALLDGAIADAVADLLPPASAIDAARERLRAELRTVEEEQGRLIDLAIAAGADVPVIARRLTDCETRRTQLTSDLVRLDNREAVTRIDPRRIERDLRQRVTEWRRLLNRHTPITRQIVMKLLDGKIVWKPEENRYLFEGKALPDRIFAGIVQLETAAPRVARARQDLNLRPPV